MMLLLVVSVSDETATQPSVMTHEPSEFILSQTEMSIYELITPEVNQSYTQDLARTLFGLADVLAEEEEGRWVVNSGNRTFEVDTRDGSMWYANYDKLWNIALGTDLPLPGTCYEMAQSWLGNNELLPDSAVFLNIGSTNVSAFNLDDGRSQSKIIQYHVNYEFVLDDIPVAGEAAQISVMIGDGVSLEDRIVGVDWKWREPKPTPYATAHLIEYESILETYGIRPSDVVDHRLVYTTDDNEEKSNLLYPVWEIEIIEDNSIEGLEVHTIVYFDATEFDPQVEIITPSSGISVMPGTSITFDCSVTFGTPPYTFEWASDFDDVLSTSQSFTTTTLSEILKEDVPVPHAISVKVKDAEDRGTSDCIAVTIEEVDFTPNPTITIVVVGSIAILLTSLLVLRKRRGGFALLFLLMMFSAFMFLPVSATGSENSGIGKYTPSAPTGAYDDGVKEIGIEWVGMSYTSKPLWNTETNIEGFYNWMGVIGGYSREFNWGEYSAWEEDFKATQFSGTDTEWIDAVDFVYYQDHGGPDGVAFTSNHDDKSLEYTALRLGDGDLDSIVFDACSPLAWENKTGHTVFQRWAPALQGVHQVLSFATGSHNSATRGTKFGLYMTGFAIIPSRTIVQAWFRATLETEPAEVQSAVFYASKSTNPLNPQLDDPINDHAYGFGYVCSDPTPGTFGWYVYITSNC